MLFQLSDGFYNSPPRAFRGRYCRASRQREDTLAVFPEPNLWNSCKDSFTCKTVFSSSSWCGMSLIRLKRQVLMVWRAGTRSLVRGSLVRYLRSFRAAMQIFLFFLLALEMKSRMRHSIESGVDITLKLRALDFPHFQYDAH